MSAMRVPVSSPGAPGEDSTAQDAALAQLLQEEEDRLAAATPGIPYYAGAGPGPMALPPPPAAVRPLPPDDSEFLGFPVQFSGIRRRALGAPGLTAQGDSAPVVTHPRDVRDIPIQWRDTHPAPAPGVPVYPRGGGGLRIEEVSEEPVPSRQVAMVEEAESEQEYAGIGEDGDEGGGMNGGVAMEGVNGGGSVDDAMGVEDAEVYERDQLRKQDAEFYERAAAAAAALAARRRAMDLPRAGDEGVVPPPPWEERGVVPSQRWGGVGVAAPQHLGGGGGMWHDDDDDPELQAALAMSIQSKEEEDMVRKALQEDQAAGQHRHRGPGMAAEGVPVSGARAVESPRAALAEEEEEEGPLGSGEEHMLPLGTGPDGQEPEPLRRHHKLHAPPPSVGGGLGDPGEMGGHLDDSMGVGGGPGDRGMEKAAQNSSRELPPGRPAAAPEAGGVGHEGHRALEPEGNCAMDEHELAGISEEECQMAAMYEAAIFGVPYVHHSNGGAMEGPTGTLGAPHSLPDAPATNPFLYGPAALREHQELLRQWEAMQDGGQRGGSPLPHGVPYGRDTSGSVGARQLVQPRWTAGYRADWEDGEEGGEGEGEEAEAERWRRRAQPAAPDPKTIEQRLLREQQDDEYQMSLLADRQKEEQARLEAEQAQRQQEEETKRREAQERTRMEEAEAYETLLKIKAANLPPEPDASCVDAITLLVRMPDGSRWSRRFLRSQLFQTLVDYIEVRRIAKEGTFQLVRQFPNRVFSAADGTSTFEQLGLTSKQEALFIRM